MGRAIEDRRGGYPLEDVRLGMTTKGGNGEIFNPTNSSRN